MNFIVIEGIDGCGKTFLCKKLAKENDWVYIKTPPKSISSKIKCKTELEELNRYKKGLLFNAKIIEKKLAKGKTIICDRYYGTYLVDCARLGEKLDFDLEKVLPKPTKIIHLIASWETIVKRLKKRRIRSELENDLISDKRAYERLVGEFRKLGYEERKNESLDQIINLVN